MCNNLWLCSLFSSFIITVLFFLLDGYIIIGVFAAMIVIPIVIIIFIICYRKVKTLLRQNRQDAARVQRMMDGLPLPTHKERVKVLME